MTYKQLQKFLGTFSDEKLDMEVYIKWDDEYHKNVALVISDETNEVLKQDNSYFELVEE